MSSVEARSSMTGSIVGMESAKLLAHELDNLLKPGKSVKQAYHFILRSSSLPSGNHVWRLSDRL